MFSRAFFFLIAGFAFSRVLFAAEISGNIYLEPPYPAIEAVKVEKKIKDSCADLRKPESLLVAENGGVQNAIVWLEGNFEKKYEAAGLPELDQKGCRFEPHVSIIPVGQKFQILNTDPLAHDIRGFAGARMLFRFEMGEGEKPALQKFEKPGIYILRCGFHSWMNAIVASAPHAYYAVSDGSGAFVLKDVPEGAYKIHVWHESLGDASGEVTAGAAPVNFSYTFKAR